MDFDSLEKLSPEEISELYNDIAEKDNLACICWANTYVTIDSDESGQLFRAISKMKRNYTYCDNEVNASYANCKAWCNNQNLPLEELPGRRIGSLTELDNYSREVQTTVFSWDGSIRSSVTYGHCIIPSEAECDWARMSTGGRVLSNASILAFRRHCSQ